MRARPGFSLLEWLVAAAILGVLMAGIGQVLAGSLQSFASVREGLETQRTLRWAIQELEGDLRAVGLRFPPPGLRGLPVTPGPGPAQACTLWPGQPLTKWAGGALVPLEAGDDPIEPPGRTSDVLALVLDRPLPVGGVLAAPLEAASPAGGLSVRLDGPCALEAGDLLWVAGDWFDCTVVQAAATLAGRGPETIRVEPGLAFAHAAGARVGLVRPLRMVRLAVVYLPLPGAARPVPCLVRFEAPYQAPDPTDPWAGLMEGAGTPEVLAERVTALRIERSPDPGGSLGLRRGPALLRVQVETRSPGPPVRHASLTWAFRLRNAGLDP